MQSLNLGSVDAAKAAQAKYGSGIMYEPHAYDFLLYAYLQSGQDDRAKWVLDQTAELLPQIASMTAITAKGSCGSPEMASAWANGSPTSSGCTSPGSHTRSRA